MNNIYVYILINDNMHILYTAYIDFMKIQSKNYNMV